MKQHILMKKRTVNKSPLKPENIITESFIKYVKILFIPNSVLLNIKAV